MNRNLKTSKSKIVVVLVLSFVLSSSGKQHVQLKVKVEKSEGSLLVELICTISKEPAVPIAVFLWNAKSLENIRLSDESCYTSQRKCQPQECGCDKHQFIYRRTLQFKEPQNIFTCEVRFDETLNGKYIHVAYQDSVLHNSSGIYSLNETKEVKGQPSSKKKQDTPKEQGDLEQEIIAALSIIIILGSVAILIFHYRETKCFKQKKPKKNLSQNTNNRNSQDDKRESRGKERVPGNHDNNPVEIKVYSDLSDASSKEDKRIQENIEDSYIKAEVHRPKAEYNKCDSELSDSSFKEDEKIPENIEETNEKTPMLDGSTTEGISTDFSADLMKTFAETKENSNASTCREKTSPNIDSHDVENLDRTDKNGRNECEDDGDKYFSLPIDRYD